jgi:hypothetical protein
VPEGGGGPKGNSGAECVGWWRDMVGLKIEEVITIGGARERNCASGMNF